jgi:DNA-binding NtrC family response regulator
VATNRDLKALQESGHFRKDLYHRLQTHHIEIPPLRKRQDDIPCLTDHLLEKAANLLKKKIPTPTKELDALLASYHFPGNVRELESMIFDAVSTHESRVLSMEVFKSRIGRMSGTQNPVAAHQPPSHAALFANFERIPTLNEAADILVQEALKRANGNQSIAARLLGTTRSALNKRLNKS